MRAFALALCALMLTGCTSTSVTTRDQARPSTTLAPGAQVIPYVPGRVTEDQRSPCRAQDNGALPDPYCTPGAVGEVRVGTVCGPRFQESRRVNVAGPRLAAMRAYGVRIEDSPIIQYDHRVPLGIGGANSTRNLWPERSDLVGKGTRNAKDSVDYTVWYSVCRAPGGRIALADAQRAFMGDWRDALRLLKIRRTLTPPGVAGD